MGENWRERAIADGSYFGQRATFLPAPTALSRQVCRRAALRASKQMAAKDGDRRNWRAVWAEHVVPMLGAK